MKNTLALLLCFSLTAAAEPKIYLIQNSHLGTPQALYDPSQETVVWKADYKPFGEATVDQDPDGDNIDIVMPIRFPGQYHDNETGLNYNYFRDYDPSLGRYVQSDPIGLRGGLNTYAYVNSSPVLFFDPYGLRGQMSRVKGRQQYDGVQRGNVVGSIQLGMLVISASKTNGVEVGAAAIPGFNMSAVACTTPPPSSQQCSEPTTEPVTSVIAGSGIVVGGIGGQPCIGIGIGSPRVSVTVTDTLN